MSFNIRGLTDPFADALKAAAEGVLHEVAVVAEEVAKAATDEIAALEAKAKADEAANEQAAADAAAAEAKAKADAEAK